INVRGCTAVLQDGREVLTATSTSGNPNACSRVGSGHFPWHLDVLLLSVALECTTSSVSRWRGWRLRPQFRDEAQNLLEHLPCDGDLGHLEDNIAAVAHYLRADLDELVLQACQRPVPDRLRRRQRAQARLWYT